MGAEITETTPEFPKGFTPNSIISIPSFPPGFTPSREEVVAPTVTRQTVSQGPAPLAPGVSTIDDGRSLIGRETAAPPPNVAASTRTIKEGEPTAEELAIASQPYRGPIIRRRPAPVAPVVNKPEPKEPLIYKTRVEALDDAVNYLEENQNLADVVKHFASLGISKDEIESHAKARNSEYVQPRVPTAPSGRYSLTNAKLQKTPSVADEIERLYSEGKPGEALKLAAQDEIKTYAKVFKTAGANLGDQATSALTTIGAMTPEDASFRIRENATARARNAPSDAVQKGMMEIKDAKTYGAVVEKMWEHPVATITMMAESVLTSLPTSAPSLLLGPAGAGVRAAAALVGSGTSEYASTMTDVLQDQKIDLRDVEQVAKALRDPKILAEIKDKGLKRGLIVGVFDGITLGLAGRFLSPVRELIREGNLVGNAARKATIGAWSKELALQVTGSVSGEVLAQKAVGEDKKAAVVLEALVSLPTSPLEVMSTFGKGPTPGETIGNALREQVARGSFTEEGIQNEVRNSLDPGRQQASNIPNRPTLEVPTKQFGSPVAKNEIPPEQPPEQKSTQTPVTSLNKEDEYVNEEDLFAPPATGEAPVVANFADRATTAADKFESAVVEQFGLTQEQAKSALATLMYIDAVKLDPLSGQFTLINGQFWAKEIMLKAAETGANLPKSPAATTTAAPILEAPAPQKTIAEILGGTNQEAAPAAEIKEEVPAADTPVTPTEEPSITEVAPPAAPSEQHKLEAIPTVYPLVSKLTLSQDVPQFKGNANASGVVKPLGGLFNTTGLAPIQVWRRLNGDLEVISGRHRLDLAKRSGVVTIPSQIHNEADGFTKKHAAILDAELNIQDEQGEVKDYVNYFQGSGISKEDANSRGLLARTKGERGFAIANEGSAELIAAHRADAFGDEAAFLITKNAPNNGKLQAVGIKALLENKTIATAINTMQAVRAISGSNQGSTDMFGFDDSAMKEAEQMASIVAKKQREIATRLSAISGAAKNPAIAKAEGIDIRDQDAVSNRIAELKQQKMAWDKWFENPEILAEVRQGLGNSPLQLQGETSADIQAKEKKQKAAAVEAGAEAKRIQEKENAETVSKEIAARSDGQVLELTPSEQVDAKAQEEIDKKEAETKLAGQKDIFDDGQQSMAGRVGSTSSMFQDEEKNSPITRIKNKLIRFASGMTAIKDLINGAYARSGYTNYGIGIDVGLLSDNGIKALASAILNLRVPVFIDSGAFSNFTKMIKGKSVAALDFDKILEKYDRITEEIGNQNEAEDTDYPRPMIVMPDIVGNQAASIELINKHKTWIGVELSSNLSQPIIPIQKGELSLADAYKKIVGILGTDDFIVGVPSMEAAVSKEELSQFLKEAKPKRIHFLGSAADSKLNPKLALVAQYSPNTNVSADASKVRSAILNGVAEGKTREQAISDALLVEDDPGYLLDLFGPQDQTQKAMSGAVGSTTKEQKDMASLHAANMGAEVVWQQGVYSLIRGYAPLSGDPLYMPTFGSLRIQRDISAVQDTRIPNDIKQKMLDAKAKSEAAADKLHKTKPFIKFDAGIATSENVSPELAGVLREWKNFLNIQSDIYISTLEDATKNRNKFTGPHRRVGSGTLNKRNFGSMRQMADGSYYILFTDSTSITKMLETIAHELGHIHEKTHFNNASPQERTALFDEHKNWLSQQKGKTAEDLVKSLRPRSIGRATTVPSEMMADTITNPLYWKSFGEWYADQTAKWAVSSKAPVGIVEKYFKRLGQALRIFFQTLKAQKYLPTETFSKYMEAVTNRPANLQPAVSDSEAQSMKADEDIVKKYNRAEVPDTNNDTIKETVLKAVQNTKDVVIEATLHPVNTTTSALVGMDRALLGARNREVFFGAALNAADIARYGGQLRTSAGLATASLALDNAIRGNIIATQVIFQGGLVYDSKTMTYRAEKTKLGMHGVYREEAKLKKKLGKKLGMQIIQGYLEAKRSQSILDELEARELEVQMQRQAVAAMTNKAGVTPAVLAKATANLLDAEAGLTAIKRVEKKINMSPDQITEFLDREKDHPELRNIMDNFNAINQNLLSFWLDVGLLSKGRYEVLSKIQDYVPWHRIMEDDVNPENTEPTSPMLSSTRSMTNIGREKIMRDGKPEVKKTFKVKIGQRIFKVKPSSDVFVEINGQALPSGAYRFTSDGTVTINSLIPLAVGDRVVITTNREIENMIDNMTRSVMRMTLNGVRQQAARRTVSEYADRDEKGRIIVYPKAERTKTSNRFSYIANGKPIIVGIEDKLISDAIYGLDTISLTSSNLMSAASNFIRRSITLSGVFQVKQVIKDAPSAAMVIKPKSPFLLIGGVYKGFVTATLRPIVNSVGKKFNSNFDIEPVVEVLLKNGIGGFHNAARTPEKEIKINLGIMNNTVAGYAFKFLDHIGDSSDVAQRVAVYKRVLKETGDETQALFHAANVINFLHRGYGGEAQFLVKNVAFIGAWANALDVLAQSMAGGGFKLAQKNKDPKGRLASQAQFLATAAKLSAATLAYCFLVGDDDEYRNLDDKSKYYNLMIPGTKIMLPMNTTAGFIFKVLPEALYNHYIDSSASTPHDRTRLATSLKHAFLDMIAGPDPIPSGIKPILEIAINYNFHTGKPLTPVSLKKDIAEEQYTGSTSELGKAISGMTGNKAIFGDKRLLNPIEADHIVRSLFGSIGSTVMWASNLMGEAALIRPTMTDKQTPIIGPLMRNEVGRNREDLFYDFKARVEQKVQTLNTMESRDKNTREFEREYRKLLSFQKEIAKTQKDLDEINKEIREYETSVRMGPSPDTRANKIINLQREKHQVLRGIERDRVEAGL